MPRLPRSVGNTYCEAAESCRDFHCTDTPVFPGAVTSCARFNLPPTSASPCFLRSVLTPSLSLLCHRPFLSPATTSRQSTTIAATLRGVSPALTRVSFAARFVSSLPPFVQRFPAFAAANRQGRYKRSSERKRIFCWALWRDADPRFLWGSQKFIVVLPHPGGTWHRAGIAARLGRAS